MASNLQEEFVRRAKRYLRYPVRSIDQVAHKLSCHTDTLKKKFKKETGLTPSEYRKSKTNGVKSFKIARAKRLLRQTDLSVGEISVRVGYANESILRRIFASQVGISPSEYRKDFRKKPIPKVVFEAQKLLTETDKTLTQVAEQLGYTQIAALSRLFEKYIGESCAAYRHRHWGSRYFPATVIKAKHLLVETDLTLKDIGKRLGFETERSLTVMIRELEAKTPRQYRIQERERLAEEGKQRDVSLG